MSDLSREEIVELNKSLKSDYNKNWHMYHFCAYGRSPSGDHWLLDGTCRVSSHVHLTAELTHEIREYALSAGRGGQRLDTG